MKRLIYSVVVLLAMMFGGNADGTVRVVASTSDLAYFARQIGGELVEVESIAHPTADVHFVEVRPSYMVKVRRADLALKVGLELDQWMDQIIDGSRNGRLTVVNCSKYIEPLEVPDFKVDARHGDIHRFGNPHYWLSPDNVTPITQAIVEGLVAVDPLHADAYTAARERLLGEIKSGLAGLEGMIKLLDGVEIVTYHNSWPYLSACIGLKTAGFIEPYPGVPPSPTHVKDLTGLIRARNIRVIGVEPYFDRRVPDKMAAETGATVVPLYPSIGGRNADESYVEWLTGNLTAIAQATK